MYACRVFVCMFECVYACAFSVCGRVCVCVFMYLCHVCMNMLSVKHTGHKGTHLNMR